MDAKQLRLLLPKNAHDAEAARNLVALGPDILGPIVPDMVRRLKDHKSPVAEIYGEFFAIHGERFANTFGDFLLRSTMPDLKNVIVTRIMIHWSRDGVAALAGALTTLVTDTNFFNTDLVSIRLLHAHGLADAKWLTDWLEFKRSRYVQLLNEADQLAAFLAKSPDAA